MNEVARPPLDPYERWMVQSNLAHIAAGEDADIIIATLRRNGYDNIADAVAADARADARLQSGGNA